MADQYVCPNDGTRLINAPNHESVTMGVVMSCPQCDSFFGYDRSTEQIVEVFDVRDLELTHPARAGRV